MQGRYALEAMPSVARAAITASRSMPAGSWTQKTNQLRRSSPRSSQGRTMSCVVVLAGGGGAQLGEPLAVERSDVVARVEHLVEALELGDADRGMEVGEPVVEAEAVVLHLVHVRGPALVALAAHGLGDLAVAE